MEPFVHPELVPSASYRTWTLRRKWRIKTVEGTLTVPAGFQTDFASVPRLLWWLFPPFGRYAPAAIAHDYLYSVRCGYRSEADKVFLGLMGRLGVAWYVRYPMWLAVRLCGWWACDGPFQHGRAWPYALARYCKSTFTRLRSAL